MISWIKDRWKWLLAGLMVLGAVFFEVFSRSQKPIVLPPVDTDQKKVEKETDEKEEQAEQAKNETVVKLEEEHAAVIQQLDDDQKKKYDELKDNPDELSSWLISVGNKNRS